MLTRGKVLLLTILCLLSLVSIGFASWTITESAEEMVYGSMHTDNVINSDEFIRLDTSKGDIENPGVKCFEYKEFGFLEEDGTNVTSTGYIYTYYVLDLEKCYNLFASEFKSIELTINLKYADFVNTDLDIFKEDDTEEGRRKLTATITCETNGFSPTISHINTPTDNQYTVNVNFENALVNYSSDSPSRIYFCVKYSLFATSGNYFYNTIFKKMYMDMITVVSFKVNVFVQGKN